jgi:CubicO group peptidase (beta-lactamase class C family)
MTLCIFSKAYSQLPTNENHRQTITKFIEGYNAQDFDQMSKQLSGIMKLVFTKNRIKTIYSYQYKLFGKARIVSIKDNRSNYAVGLLYERDTTELVKLGLAISKKNKIIGMGSSDLKLNFSNSTIPTIMLEENIKNKIDSLVTQKFIAGNYSGCVLVMKKNTVFYQSCQGYADVNNKQVLHNNTLFDLASLSKQFTAMAIMILVKQGKLSYQNVIQDFYPDFPYKNIKIENLLTHTSGLPDYMEVFDKYWDKSKIATNDDVIKLLSKFKPKPSFKPSKKYEYSNTGYVLLASIIEKVSGKTYAAFLDDNIFKPLYMEKSSVFSTKYSTTQSPNNFAKGYTYSPNIKSFVLADSLKENEYYIYLSGIVGDGAVHSTLNDLAIWDKSIREYTLVSKEIFDQAIKPFKTNKELSQYGYGWELINEEQYEKLIYHSGNWGGNTHFMLHFLDKEITIIALSNNEYNNIQNLVIRIATVLLNNYR